MAASKKQLVAGWILSGLLAVFLIGLSAPGKFTEFEGKAQMFEHLGYSYDTMKGIGVVEIVVTLLFLIPRTAFIGAILVTAYLGGATATHVRVGDPYFMPIAMGVLVWFGYALWRPDVIKSAFGSGRSSENSPK